MKKLLISLLAVSALGFGFNAIAQNSKVMLKEKPAKMMKQGDMWMVPEGTTTSYFMYTDNGMDYVCSATEPTELVGMNAKTVTVKMTSGPTTVKCYSSSNFMMPK